jgi:adenylylsulfate kinase
MSQGAIVWITGLPSAGKSTLARALATRLREHGRPALLLDGDELRAALVPKPGYDEASRDSFYATLAGIAALVEKQSMVAIVAATANRAAFRDRARRDSHRFIEVFVATPAAECARRDDKGLWANAAAGLPGAGATYETPAAPEVIAQGGHDAAAIDRILALLTSTRPDPAPSPPRR